jgi:hypothetical protein
MPIITMEIVMIHIRKCYYVNVVKIIYVMTVAWKKYRKIDESYDQQFGKLYDGKVVRYTILLLFCKRAITTS